MHTLYIKFTAWLCISVLPLKRTTVDMHFGILFQIILHLQEEKLYLIIQTVANIPPPSSPDVYRSQHNMQQGFFLDYFFFAFRFLLVSVSVRY